MNGEMKWFFVPLSFKWSNSDTYDSFGRVYGPYDSEEKVHEKLAKCWPNNKSDFFLIFEGKVTQVRPSTLEKPEEEKREPGNMDNYEEDGEGGCKCKDCGAKILAGKVAHPIHFREMPGAGPGECQYEDVPYCPNCEKKPNFHGEPTVVSYSMSG